MISGPPVYVRSDAFTSTLIQRRLSTRVKRKIERIFSCSLSVQKKQSFHAGPGSREHYWHFLLGYLLPLVHAQERYKFKFFHALDCGPLMTPILRDTLAALGYRFQILIPRAVRNPVFLEPWDLACAASDSSTQALRDTCIRVGNLWREGLCSQKHCHGSSNLLLKRSAPHPYYLNGKAELSGYGTSRRAITNWDEVCTLLDREGVEYLLYEPGCHSLACQIRTFSQARRIVGMRGAEWANVVWAQPDLKILFFDPDPPAELAQELFSRLQLNVSLIGLDDAHAAIRPEHVLQFLEAGS